MKLTYGQLHKLKYLADTFRPFEIDLQEVEVLGKALVLAELRVDDQRDGKFFKKYLLGVSVSGDAVEIE